MSPARSPVKEPRPELLYGNCLRLAERLTDLIADGTTMTDAERYQLRSAFMELIWNEFSSATTRRLMERVR